MVPYDSVLRSWLFGLDSERVQRELQDFYDTGEALDVLWTERRVPLGKWSPPLKINVPQGGTEVLHMQNVIGRGRYGTVLRGRLEVRGASPPRKRSRPGAEGPGGGSGSSGSSGSDSSSGAAAAMRLIDAVDVAVKVEESSLRRSWLAWDFLAQRTVVERLRLLGGEESGAEVIAAPLRLWFFYRTRAGDPAQVCMLSPLGCDGTLHDLLRRLAAHAGRSGCFNAHPPEVLALAVAAELLRCVRSLHLARVLHADVKPDNILADLSRPQGGLALRIIDFGRSCDVAAVGEGVMFTGSPAVSGFECPAMREGRPWREDADWYAVAAVVFECLYGGARPLTTVASVGEGGRRLERLGCALRRYWNADIWRSFFDLTLNGAAAADSTRALERTMRDELALPQRRDDLRRVVDRIRRGAR